MKKKIGRTRIISNAFKGRDNIIVWDVLQIKNEQDIRVTFISAKSNFKQGIRVAIDVGEGYIEVDGQKSKGMKLWQDTATCIDELKCFSSEGLVSVYNIWDRGQGSESQAFTSGMLVEEEGNKRIYNCNDFGYETNFDKLVFTIELL